MVTMTPSKFHGKHFVLLFANTANLKLKSKYKNAVKDNGGIVSYIITKGVNYLVVNDDVDKDNFKVKQALKVGIPVVRFDFIDQCLEHDKLLHTDDFIVHGETLSQQFHRGLIPMDVPSQPAKQKIDIYKVEELNQDEFDSKFQYAVTTVLKYQTFSKVNAVAFVLLEQLSDGSVQCGFRTLLTKFEFSKSGETKLTSTAIRVTDAAQVAISLYADYFEKLYKDRFKPCDLSNSSIRACLNDLPKALKTEVEERLIARTKELSPELGELVETLWEEALGEVSVVLSCPLDSIKMDKVEKAESILLDIRECLSVTKPNEGKIETLSTEYYSLIPHKSRTTLCTKRLLSKEDSLCQLIRDLIAANEATNWNGRPETVSKYAALKCYMAHLEEDSEDFRSTHDLIMDTLDEESQLEILNIFTVSRPGEVIVDKGYRRFLFHSSNPANFAGILSRGLLLPRVVVDDLGGTRTDPGNLGHGIYFAADASVSAGYSIPSRSRGTRFMMVCDVLLGEVYQTTERIYGITEPLSGFDSVQGVVSRDAGDSGFKHEEYAIYRTDHQSLCYLVEFRLPSDQAPLPAPEMILAVDADVDLLEDVEKISETPPPVEEVTPGLVTKDGSTAMPLTSVLVRAKLVDLAAEVVVIQSYTNTSPTTVEAKYVFPLDEMAAVCGFEAYINDVHVVGVVKERETAHREYKEAVAAGHGAYLMDQDKETPDVFTVSVGNLPAGATVIIKITYVTELLMEGDYISWRLPGSVAPWKEREGLESTTQDTTDTLGSKVGEHNFHLQVALEMPYEIREIKSSTHQLKIKRTECKAVLEPLPPDNSKKMLLGDSGFHVLVLLSELHVARMWAERTPDDESGLEQACMLAFFPEFELAASRGSNKLPACEITLLIDCSNSMRGQGIQVAKLVAKATIRALPKGAKFNVITFGTYFEELFPISRLNMEKNRTQAINYIEASNPTQGSSEALRPLDVLCKLVDQRALLSTRHNVYLISDGHLNSEDTLYRLMKTSDAGHRPRIFTFGVTSTCNRFLLRKLALLGGGCFQYFDVKQRSKWPSKIEDQINKSMQPGLSNVSIEWIQHDSAVPRPVQAPSQIVSVYNGDRLVVYGFAPICTEAVLHAKIGDRDISTMVSTSELSTSTGKVLHCLTAKALISDWDDGMLAEDSLEHESLRRSKKDYIVEVSKKHQIISPFTSFIAIEERDKTTPFQFLGMEEKLQEILNECSVDILDYMGWTKGEKEAEEEEEDRLVLEDKVSIRDALDEVRGLQYSNTKEAYRMYSQMFEASTRLLKPTDVLALAIIYNFDRLCKEETPAVVSSPRLRENMATLLAEMKELVAKTKKKQAELHELRAEEARKITEAQASSEESSSESDAESVSESSSESSEFERAMGWGDEDEEEIYEERSSFESSVQKIVKDDEEIQLLEPRGAGRMLRTEAAPDALLVDTGESFVRASGLVDSTRGSVDVPCVVGRPRHQGVMVGMGQKDAYVGREAIGRERLGRVVQAQAPTTKPEILDDGLLDLCQNEVCYSSNVADDNLDYNAVENIYEEMSQDEERAMAMVEEITLKGFSVDKELHVEQTQLTDTQGDYSIRKLPPQRHGGLSSALSNKQAYEDFCQNEVCYSSNVADGNLDYKESLESSVQKRIEAIRKLSPQRHRGLKMAKSKKVQSMADRSASSESPQRVSPQQFGGGQEEQDSSSLFRLFGAPAQVQKGAAKSSALFGFGAAQSGYSDPFETTPASAPGLFGTPQSSAPGTFGAAQSSATGTFGAAQSSAPGLFGAAQSSATVTFGAAQSSATGTFRAAQSSAPGLFGAAQSSAPGTFGAAQSNVSGLFGATQSSGLFGLAHPAEQRPPPDVGGFSSAEKSLDSDGRKMKTHGMPPPPMTRGFAAAPGGGMFSSRPFAPFGGAPMPHPPPPPPHVQFLGLAPVPAAEPMPSAPPPPPPPRARTYDQLRTVAAGKPCLKKSVEKSAEMPREKAVFSAGPTLKTVQLKKRSTESVSWRAAPCLEDSDSVCEDPGDLRGITTAHLDTQTSTLNEEEDSIVLYSLSPDKERPVSSTKDLDTQTLYKAEEVVPLLDEDGSGLQSPRTRRRMSSRRGRSQEEVKDSYGAEEIEEAESLLDKCLSSALSNKQAYDGSGATARAQGRPMDTVDSQSYTPGFQFKLTPRIIDDITIQLYVTQNKDGSWEFNEEVCRLIGEDFAALKSKIYSAGIESFGSYVTGKLVRLFMTVLVLVNWSRISQCSVEELPVFFEDYPNSRPNWKAALAFCRETEADFPLTCYQMELADTWLELAYKISGQRVC